MEPPLRMNDRIQNTALHANAMSAAQAVKLSGHSRYMKTGRM